jgi:carbamoyltransferase
MLVLGISCFYHDSAAALIENGEILAAIQEERMSRKKHDDSFPSKSIEACLKISNKSSSEIDYVIFYEKPLLKFDRILETYLAFAPKGFTTFLVSMPLWLRDKLFLRKVILKHLKNLDSRVPWKNRLLFSEHHLSHSASAFYPSPFEEAAIITMDGVGEWTTTSIGIGRGTDIEIKREIRFPHSLGLLYSAFTYFCGFKVNSGEYKLMGLAPYGEPKYADLIRKNLISIKDDGSFRLNMKYFGFGTGKRMTNKNFDHLFGGSPRLPESELTQREMDIAASIQEVTEEIVLKISRFAVKEFGVKNLCLAGGVALNCVANGKLVNEELINDVFIQPAAGDAGGALGAALYAYYKISKSPRHVSENVDSMRGSFLGPAYQQAEVEKRLRQVNARFTVAETDEIIAITTEALINGLAVGWFQGRMEFGPRSLGARSIIADPRSSIMQSLLNNKIKFRESFRPFAPSIMKEFVSEWFNMEKESPYMLLVSQLKESARQDKLQMKNELFGLERLHAVKSKIPAVTHVDYSARVQTVNREINPLFHKLIKSFFELTGVPILVNTSFNVRGEPIVESPENAFKCFMGTDLDLLIVERCILWKQDQELSERHKYFDEYALD